jgi:ABC-2 type transport system ATP-binding protein
MTLATIEFKGLTKDYGKNIAVKNLSAEVFPGRVTGFLGPNGAGKSTALRCLLGLVTPTSGNSTINSSKYHDLVDPYLHVGAVLDSRGFHPGLTARQNLKVMAAASGVDKKRIEEVIEMVDLKDAIDKRTKKYSLGMKQRLSLATALLGDPEVMVLDEPANGLDPIGIVWLRQFLKSLAKEGKTILVSSHQLTEMQNTVDDVLIIHKGELVASGNVDAVCAGRSLEQTFLDLTSKAV